jgi:hypothetical protein
MGSGQAPAASPASPDLAARLRDILGKGAFVVTGIGSRDTPRDVMEEMTILCGALEKAGGRLRSGGAGGADLACEAGFRDALNCEIYHPWHGFVPKVNGLVIDVETALGRKRPLRGPGGPIVIAGDVMARAEAIAAQTHPKWSACSRGARALHTRNIPQVLGEKLDRVTDLILCWTVDGQATGGTGQALRLGMEKGVTIVNLKNAHERAAIFAALEL